MTGVTILVGAQWGDEGKGKWVDILAEDDAELGASLDEGLEEIDDELGDDEFGDFEDL